MVYLTADGSVVEKRSLFRLSLPLDILWGVIDFVSIFFQTLIDPEGAKAEGRTLSAEDDGKFQTKSVRWIIR